MFRHQPADYSSPKERRVKTPAGAETADKQAAAFTFVWQRRTKRQKRQKNKEQKQLLETLWPPRLMFPKQASGFGVLT